MASTPSPMLRKADVAVAGRGVVRAAVVLAAAGLAAVGVWLWQRAADAPALEVVAGAPPAAEAPQNAAGSLAAPGSSVSLSAVTVASLPAEAAAWSPGSSAGPPAGGPDEQDAGEPGSDGADEAPEVSCDETYTYWDGDAQRTVSLCSDGGGGGGAGGSSAAGGGPADRGDRLVFRSESGVEMTLEHSIVLVLDPGWSSAEVDRFLTRNGIEPSRVSPMDWLPNGFTITTGAGIAPLVLANTLALQDGVVLSSPNWASEFEAK